MARPLWSVRLVIAVVLALLVPAGAAVASPDGTLTWAVHI